MREAARDDRLRDGRVPSPAETVLGLASPFGRCQFFPYVVHFSPQISG